MKILKSILISLVIAVNFISVDSDKILVISFFSSKSHAITYKPLLEELAKRGHEITVVSPVKPTKTVKGIKEVFTIDVDEIMRKLFNTFEMKEKGLQMDFKALFNMVTDVCNKSYQIPEVKEIVNQKFDLIFTKSLFDECVMGLVYRLKAPLVLFSPITAASFMVNKLGGYYPPSFVPHGSTSYTDEMDFFQRFKNYGLNIAMGAMTYYYERKMTELYREALGDDIPPVAEIYGNASLLLSNGHFALSKPRPNLPDVIEVGGLHSHPAKPLPKDLEEFVSKSKDGFILFSMGSVNKADLMADEKRKMFLKVFSKLKQQVLWKWDSGEMKGEAIPPNVKLSPWLPQEDLLGHKNIRFFITHCGAGSTEEAIYHGVPLIGIPMFGDQLVNAMQAKNLGYLLELDWNLLREEILMEAIQEILNNKKYKENVHKLSTIFKDQIETPLERGVFWIEYVLRHKGAPHLRSASRKLNFIQYHSFDVLAFYVAITFGSLYTIFAILRWVLRKICGCFGGNSKKAPNKKKTN